MFVFKEKQNKNEFFILGRFWWSDRWHGYCSKGRKLRFTIRQNSKTHYNCQLWRIRSLNAIDFFHLIKILQIILAFSINFSPSPLVFQSSKCHFYMIFFSKMNVLTDCIAWSKKKQNNWFVITRFLFYSLWLLTTSVREKDY